eukprot:7691606-Pyramimonas_sp.AAC.1
MLSISSVQRRVVNSHRWAVNSHTCWRCARRPRSSRSGSNSLPASPRACMNLGSSWSQYLIQTAVTH